MILPGYVAEKVFDSVVFLQNEFWKYCRCDNDIKETIDKVSKELNINKTLILKALYINVTLTIAWNIEDNVEKRVIDNNLKNLYLLNHFILNST